MRQAAGSLTAPAAQFPESPRIKDSKRSGVGRLKKILVPGDQHVGVAGDRGGEDPAIVGVPDRDRKSLVGLGDNDVLAQELLDGADRGGRKADPVSEDPSEFGEIDLTRQELMLRENKPEDVGAKAPGSEGADEDVRVEKNPHDTSRLTSSSVR